MRLIKVDGDDLLTADFRTRRSNAPCAFCNCSGRAFSMSAKTSEEDGATEGGGGGEEGAAGGALRLTLNPAWPPVGIGSMDFMIAWRRRLSESERRAGALLKSLEGPACWIGKSASPFPRWKEGSLKGSRLSDPICEAAFGLDSVL